MRDPEVAAAARELDRSDSAESPTATGSRYGMTVQEREFRRAYVEALIREIPEAAEFYRQLREDSPRERFRRGGGDREQNAP